MKEIGKDAFSGCRSLVSVVILDDVKEIGDAAFGDCPNLVIHAPKGSNAIEHARKSNIKFMET